MYNDFICPSAFSAENMNHDMLCQFQLDLALKQILALKNINPLSAG